MSFAATSRSPFTRAGVLLAFGLAACQPAAPPGEPADLLIVNGRVFAADAAGTTAEAVAVRGQTIARVGTTAELSALRGPATRVIDARGGSVLPGFNDAHVHILSGGFSLSHLDLGGLTTLRQVQAAISAFAATTEDSPEKISPRNSQVPSRYGSGSRASRRRRSARRDSAGSRGRRSGRWA